MHECPDCHDECSCDAGEHDEGDCQHECILPADARAKQKGGK